MSSGSHRSWFVTLSVLGVTAGVLIASTASAGDPKATTPSTTPSTTIPTTIPTSIPAAVPAAVPAAPRVEQSLLLAYLADKTVFTLFDARSPEEFQASHVEGAINLPIERVAAENPALPGEKSDPIVVYCKTGTRATAVAGALTALGYQNVRVLPSEQLMFHDDLVIFNCSNGGNG